MAMIEQGKQRFPNSAAALVVIVLTAVLALLFAHPVPAIAETHYEGEIEVQFTASPGDPIGAVFTATAPFDAMKLRVRNPHDVDVTAQVTLHPYQLNYLESVKGAASGQWTISVSEGAVQWIELPLGSRMHAGKYVWQLTVSTGSLDVFGTGDGELNGSGEAYKGGHAVFHAQTALYTEEGAAVQDALSPAGALAQRIRAGESFNALSVRGFTSGDNGALLFSIYPWGGSYEASVADYNTDPLWSAMWDVEDRLIARVELTGIPASEDAEFRIPLPTLPKGDYLVVATASERNEAASIGLLRFDGSTHDGGEAYVNESPAAGDYAFVYGNTADPAFETESEPLIANAYFSLSEDGENLAAVSFDAAGNGHYAHGVAGLDIKDRFKAASPVYRIIDEATLLIDNIAIYGSEWKIGGIYDSAFAVMPNGGRLGQTFTAPIPFSNISFHVWTPVPSGADFTLRLRKGVDGELLAEKHITNHTAADGIWYDLDFAPQPAGEEYYAEIENLAAETYVYWLGHGTNPYAEGVLIENGTVIHGVDADLRIRDLDPGSLTIALNGDTLTADFRSDLADAGLYTARIELNTPWQKKGYFTYDTNTHYFSKIYTTFSDYYSVEQLKRRSEQIIDRIARSVVTAAGQEAYNLELEARNSPIDSNPTPWGMVFDDDRLRLHMRGNGLTLRVMPRNGDVPDFYPKFTTSDPDFDADFNRLYLERGFGAFVANPQAPWFNWTSIIHSWADTGYRELLKRSIQEWKVGGPSDPYPDYVYSWSVSQPGWPMPVDGDGDGIDEYADYDKRHFDTNAGYIVAAHRMYMTTRDYEWLAVETDANGETMMDKLRRAMDFQLRQESEGGLGGERGYVTLPGPYHDGTGGLYSLPSNHWDAIPFGHLDLATNVLFYKSLLSMAELEQVMGNLQASREYEKLARKVQKHFGQQRGASDQTWTFWDHDAGRYVGTIDVNGVRRDFGFVELNLQVLTAGLAHQRQAEQILDEWLDGPEHDDIYYFKISPRTSTIDRTGIWEPMAGTYPAWVADWPGGPDWIGNMQNLGTIFYSSYYDIMARVKYKDADNAWSRMSAIMDRYRQPDRLSGGDPFLEGWRDTFEAGIAVVFPESGLVPTSFLTGFMGIDFGLDGMTVTPALPGDLDFAKVEHLSYWGNLFTITVTRTDRGYAVTIEAETNSEQMNFTVKKGVKTELGDGRFRITAEIRDGETVTLVNQSHPGR
jgi:hypothetical protein